MSLIKSQQDFYNLYTDEVKYQDSRLNPKVKASFWDTHGVAQSGLFFLLQQFSLNRLNAAFASQSSGLDLDFLLSENGLPSRLINVPGIMNLEVDNTTAADITLPANSSFKYANIEYLVSIDTIIPANTANVYIGLYSKVSGIGNQVVDSVIMTPSAPIVGLANYKVISCTDGLTEEDDASVLSRILSYQQDKISCGNLTDFASWAFSVPNITNSFAFIDPLDSEEIRVVGLAGGLDIDTLLANDLVPYSRTPSATQLHQITNVVMQNRYPTGYFRAIPAVTYGWTQLKVNVSVRLLSGYTLTTILTDFGITVQKLIQRQVRRAILMTPVGGNSITDTFGNNSILLFASDIEATLDLTLGLSASSQGFVKPILVSRQAKILDAVNAPVDELQLPALYDSTGDNSYCVYDIDPNNITVVAI